MPEAELFYQIVIIITLIFMSAFFSSSETALTSISEDLLQKKVAEKDQKAVRTQKLLKKKELAISAILLGNNLVNILSSAVATNIFIKEGFKFNVANALLTNFHLPQSSLLMLVCAFAGKELIFSMYEFAIKNNLRFFSYGDAMIIERCPLNY